MENKKSNSKKQWSFRQASVAISLMLVLVCSAVLIPIFTLRANTPGGKDDDPVIQPALDQQTSESTQMLRDMPMDLYFDITSIAIITNENIRDFVRVVDIRESAIDVSIEQRNGYFRVNPPTELYLPGETYFIELQNARFRDERLRNQNAVKFTISGEERKDIIFNDKVLEVNEQYVQSFDEETGILVIIENGITYNVGDIIMVPTYFGGIYVDTALRILEVITHPNGDVILRTETPYMDEVFDELEIYGSFESRSEDIHFFSEEEIKQSLLEHESIQAISFAVAQMSNEQISPINSSRPRGMPSSVSLSISGVRFVPFQARGSLRVGWRFPIGRTNDFGASNYNMHVAVTLSFSIQVENYINVSADSDRYSSGTITTTTVSVSVDAYFTGALGQALLDSSARARRMMDRAYAFAAPNNMMSPDNLAEIRNTRDELQSFDDLRDWHNDRMEVHEGNVQNQLRVLDALADEYRNQQQGIGAGIVPLFILPIPVFAGVTFMITAGLVFDIDLQAGFKAEYTFTQVETNGQITTEHGTIDYQNTTTTHSVSLMLYGRLEIRIGAGIELRLTIAKIFYVSVTATGGGYLNFHGAIAAHWGNGDSNFFEGNQNALFGVCSERGQLSRHWAGTGSFEAGGFFSATITVGVRFRILFVRIDISHTIPIFERRWPITFNGEDPYVIQDLVTRNNPVGNTTLEFGRSYVMTYEEKDTAKHNTVQFNEDNGYSHQIPYLYIRSIDKGNRTVTYERVQPSRTRIETNDYVGMTDGGLLYPKNLRQFSIDELLVVYVVDTNGRRTQFSNLLRVQREPIPVETINLHVSSGTNEIRVGQTRHLVTQIFPLNASFPNANFEVESVITGGRVVRGAATMNYVRLHGSGTLAEVTALNNLNPGDTINIVATTEFDGVRSNTFTFDVVRTPVDQVHLVTQNNVTSATLGQVLPFDVITDPNGSTFAITGTHAQVTILDESLGRIERISGNRFTLTITNDANMLGRQIGIKIIVNDNGNIIERIFHLHIREIHLAGLTINNADTGEELGANTQVNQGETLRLVPILDPIDATLQTRINFLTNVTNEFVYITQSGELRIRPNAPVGFTFTVTALYGHIASKNYTFTVIAIPVEYVTISSPVAEAAPGDMFALSSDVLPASATFRQVQFEVIQGSEWAYIHHGNFLVIRNDAPLGALITVRGVADGVESNIITVTIPLRGITIGSTRNSLSTGESMRIDYQFNPSPNTISPIEFFIYSGNQFAIITREGILTIKNCVDIRNAQIVIRARNQSVYSNRVTININVPVSNVTLSSESENGRTRVGNSVALFVDIYPRFATNQEVIFEVVENPEYAFVFNGRLVVENRNVTIGARVGIIAVVDGVPSQIYRIELLPVPVIFVELVTGDLYLEYGSSYKLIANARPDNATFRDVRFEIIEGEEFGWIDGNYVRIFANAPVGSIIRIIAVADGIESEDYITVTVTRVFVTSVEIETTNNLQRVTPGSTLQFTTRIEPINASFQSLVFTLVAGIDSATITSNGWLTIRPTNYFRHGMTMITVQVSVDGRTSSISFYVYIPIDNIVLNPPVDLPERPSIDMETTFEIRPGFTIDLDETINPYFNTFEELGGFVTFYIIEGMEFATIDGNRLTINKNIQTSDAFIRVRAYTQGVWSNIIRLNIYVPVQSVVILPNTINQLMLGEYIYIFAQVNPDYATSKTMEFMFVGADGGELGYSPLSGLTINQGTGRIQVTNNRAIVNQVFHIRAFAGGVGSDKFTIKLIPRPVTNIYPTHIGNSTVNPGTTEHTFSAWVNEDATFRQLHFRILDNNNATRRTSWGTDEYTRHYFVFDVLRTADPYGRIRIEITAFDFPPRIVEFIIKPIYATAIQDVTIVRNGTTPIDTRTEFPYALGNMAMARPGETLSVSAINTDTTNSTFGYFWTDNYRLSVLPNDFTNSAVVNGNIQIRPLSQFHHLMSPSNNSFVIRVELFQGREITLVHEITIRVFVPISIPVLTYTTAGQMNGYREFNVDRMRWCSNENKYVYNQFIFNFQTNGGRYSSHPLLSVDDIRANKELRSAPESTYIQTGNNKPLVINFMDVYTAGTRFTVNLINPDNNQVVFWFVLVINPLNTQHGINFVNYQISDQNNRTFNDLNPSTRVINDLMAGNSVEVIFGNRGFGAGITNGASLRVTAGSDVSIGSIIDGNRIRINPDARDGDIFRFRIVYEDGKDQFDQEFTIRVFRRIAPSFTINFREGNVDARFIEDTTVSLSHRFRDPGYRHSLRFEAIPRPVLVNTGSMFFPNWQIVDRFDFHINGQNMVFDDVNTTQRYHRVRVFYIQHYNGLTFEHNHVESREQTLTRRFIRTQAQLSAIRQDPRNNEGAFHMRNPQPIILSGYWTPIPEFGARLYGHGSRIYNMTISIPNTNFATEHRFGLFERLIAGAMINNLHLPNVNITTAGFRHGGSHVQVGSFAGVVDSGAQILNSGASGWIDIDRMHSNVGGIVGSNFGTVRNNNNWVTVRGVGALGGIAGGNNSTGRLESNNNHGLVSYHYRAGQPRSVGGIVGWNSRGGVITHNLQFGMVEARNTVQSQVRIGTIIGHNEGAFSMTNSPVGLGGYTIYWRGTDNTRFIYAYFHGRVGRQVN
ncbi:MAG: hypothetical protein FWE45_00740 [Firmicutes bacterium]|nr:hypothetical protein [Bacillota bacterium]